MAETNYTPVSDGFHDCKIVFAKRAEKHYGREIKGHVVYELKLVATDCPEIDSPAAYKAEMPVLLVPGFEWDFYDETAKKGVWRKATAADTKAAIEYAQRCFPAWRDYCDQLPEGSDDFAFSWFNDSNLAGAVTIRAKFTNNGTYTGSDGMDHADLKAKVYPQYEAKPILADGEGKQIANALKAAGVKLYGNPKSSKADAKPVPPAMPKPPAPPNPSAKSVDKLREDAFAKYQDFFADDSTGAGFYPKCGEILKRDMNTWESWTVDDWQKICDELAMPF